IGDDDAVDRVEVYRPPAQPQVHRRLRNRKLHVGQLLVAGQHTLGAGGPVVGSLVAEYRQLAGEAEPAQFVGGRHAGRSGIPDDDAVAPAVGHRVAPSPAIIIVVAVRLSMIARAGHTRAALTTCSTW